MKTVVQRNLPLSETYHLQQIHSYSLLDSGYTCICENCGKLLVNYADIQDSKGNMFKVGLDCMKTLTMKPVLISSSYTSEDMVYDFNQYLSFLTACNYPDAEIVNDGHFLRVFYTTPKGKDASKMETIYNVNQFSSMADFTAKYGYKMKQL